MNRRDSVLALLALGGAPMIARAQTASRVPLIAYFGFGDPSAVRYLLETLKLRMRELGYVEGKSIRFEERWGMGKFERIPEIANGIVALKPDVIFCASSFASFAAKQATATIPIVFATVSNPDGSGLVKSLARPGGNITGLANMSSDSSPKLLELVRVVVPKLSQLAILKSPESPPEDLRTLQRAVQQSGVDCLVVEAQNEAELKSAFLRITKERARAVIVLSSSTFSSQRRLIAELAIKHRLPTVFTTRWYAESGGLISYGADFADQVRRAATHVDKILKGAHPGDLPVEQAVTLELVINLKTARAIGITIPNELLFRADLVIE